MILVNVLVEDAPGRDVQWQPLQLFGLTWIRSNVNLNAMVEVSQLVMEVCQLVSDVRQVEDSARRAEGSARRVAIGCRIGKVAKNKGKKGLGLQKRGQFVELVDAPGRAVLERRDGSH